MMEQHGWADIRDVVAQAVIIAVIAVESMWWFATRLVMLWMELEARTARRQ